MRDDSLSRWMDSALLRKRCDKKQKIIDHKNPDSNNSNKAIYTTLPVIFGVRHDCHKTCCSTILPPYNIF